MYDGDHVVDAYSSIGLTYVLNARTKIKALRDIKQRLISPDLWLALLVMVLM